MKPASVLLELPIETDCGITISLLGFAELTRLNPELQLERTRTGELIVNPPTGWESSKRNSTLNGLLFAWWLDAGQPGHLFDSSGGFILPNGAVRSPDASWVSDERWNERNDDTSTVFANICPDFVVELRSATDPLPPLQNKMTEYIDNGARLGWLLDPQNRCVEIYRPDGSIDRQSSPTTLSGEAILPGFKLALSWIWTS